MRKGDSVVQKVEALGDNFLWEDRGRMGALTRHVSQCRRADRASVCRVRSTHELGGVQRMERRRRAAGWVRCSGDNVEDEVPKLLERFGTWRASPELVLTGQNRHP